MDYYSNRFIDKDCVQIKHDKASETISVKNCIFAKQYMATENVLSGVKKINNQKEIICLRSTRNFESY